MRGKCGETVIAGHALRCAALVRVEVPSHVASAPPWAGERSFDAASWMLGDRLSDLKVAQEKEAKQFQRANNIPDKEA